MAYEPTEWKCGETVSAERMNKIEQGVAEIMSEYVPTEWKCGDILTAEALNKIEQGIANADCGGGGSSDFSTAEVTVVNPVGSDGIAGPFIIDNKVGCLLEEELGTNTYQVAMGTSGALIYSFGGELPSVSGSIELVSGGTYLVTGDCTITIS